jgi:hypothetical protein
VLTGSLMPLCYAHGMTKYLNEQRIRIFDYAQFAQPIAERLGAHAEALAQAQSLTIEYIRKKNFRKEAALKPFSRNAGASRAWCISFQP